LLEYYKGEATADGFTTTQLLALLSKTCDIVSVRNWLQNHHENLNIICSVSQLMSAAVLLITVDLFVKIGYTALHLASKVGNINMVKCLIEHNIPLNTVSIVRISYLLLQSLLIIRVLVFYPRQTGDTALQIAIKIENDEIVKELLLAHADCDVLYEVEWLLLLLACCYFSILFIMFPESIFNFGTCIDDK
jgi:hypothetical protein